MSSIPVIGIDCRFSSVHGGLGTHTRGLVSSLTAMAPEVSFVLFVTSSNEDWLQSLPTKNVHVVTADIPHYSLREQIQLPRLIRSSGCTFFFAPQFNVPIFCPVPFVCTVHDLILHHYPNEAGFLKRLAYRFLMHFSITHARAIFTVSHATKSDLLSMYPKISSKVFTVYPGIDITPLPSPQQSVSQVRTKYDLTLPYFLYVGNCKEHKNVPFLVQSFLSMDISTHALVLVCSGAECNFVPPHPRIRRLSNVDSLDLKALYSGAVALVTATKKEGFGLPVLEAMIQHCPVIASDVPSLREIASDHAELLPLDQPAFIRAMRRRASTTKSDLDDATVSAFLHAEAFTWERSAKQFLERLRPLLIN